MKNNILKCMIAGACAALSLNACIDDLNVERLGALDMETFYQTDAQASEAVTQCYTLLSNLQMRDMLNCMSGDALAGGATRGEMKELEEMVEFSFGVENNQIKSAFEGLYKMVYAANLVISRVAPDTDLKRQYIAEAKFFRAYAYYDLAVLWGDVPLITEPNTDGNYSVSRTPVENVWNQVITDLEEAISSGDLTEKADMNDKNGSIRVTKQTCPSSAWQGIHVA